MKKLIYLFLVFGACLSTVETSAQSSNLTQAYENGFNDGYNFGFSNNEAGYQAASTLVNHYTTGGGPGSGAAYLAAYRDGLSQGWTTGYNAYLADQESGSVLKDFLTSIGILDDDN